MAAILWNSAIFALSYINRESASSRPISADLKHIDQGSQAREPAWSELLVSCYCLKVCRDVQKWLITYVEEYRRVLEVTQLQQLSRSLTDVWYARSCMPAS